MGRASVSDEGMSYSAAMAYEFLAKAFKNGDVIYGLDEPRKSAYEAVKKAGFKESVSHTKKILKVIPIGKEKRAVVLIQNTLTNAVWSPLDGAHYSSDEAIAKELEDAKRGKEFKKFLSEHPRYDVAKQASQNPNQDPKQSWKRTSKAGLEFQLKCRRGIVHFVVDKIIDNLAMVATKKQHGTSITSAELRWLYRHRNLHLVQDNVRFWLPAREVTHAELFNKKEWQSYIPKQTYADSDWEAKPPISQLIQHASKTAHLV
jgi:insecticidal toxin complex protein TccC